MFKRMRKFLLFYILATLLTSCTSEFNKVYKSPDNRFKYEYAKECFANGKYTRAISLLQELVTTMKGTENAQECLYMLSMAQYNQGEYETAAEYFKKYYSSYPRGTKKEKACSFASIFYWVPMLPFMRMRAKKEKERKKT